MNKKVIITGAKHIIEGECKLIIHIPKVEMPLRMNRIKNFIVRKDVIEFYGNSAKAYNITRLIDAVEVAKAIVAAIENRLPQLILAEDLFAPPVPKIDKEKIPYPPLLGCFILGDLKASAIKKFRNEIGIDLREWKQFLDNKGLPERFEENNELLIIALEKYFNKPAMFSQDPNFWKNLVDAEIARTTPTT